MILWDTEDLPDPSLTVLVRTEDEDWPVAIGFHDGKCWRDSDGMQMRGVGRGSEPVLGWMTLQDAARALDGARERASGEGESRRQDAASGTPPASATRGSGK
jgi:hypothetical protein